MLELSFPCGDEAFAGAELEVPVQIATDAPLDVTSIEVWLRGEECWKYPEMGREHVDLFIEEHVRVANICTLAPGNHQFVARFQLPPDAPATHGANTNAAAYLHAVAILDRGGWTKPRKKMWFRVRRTTPKHPVPVSATLRATDGEDEIEVSLDSTAVVIGDALRGTLVARFDTRRTVDVIMELLAATTRRDSPEVSGRVWTTLVVPVTAGRHGTPIPFEIPLTAAMAPTFSSPRYHFGWELVVSPRVGMVWPKTRGDLALEVFDVDPSRPSTLRVASSTLEAVFAAFAAATGWRADPDRLAISHAGEHGTLAIAYHVGLDGPRLLARIEHPWLGLGLHVERNNPAREVRGRNADQTAPFLREIVPVLREAHALGTIVHWRDDELLFGSDAVDTPPLRSIADALDRVAAAIAAAARAIPPPQVDIDVAAWRVFADSLDARIAPGDLVLDGGFEGRPVRVRSDWDHEPLMVGVRVGPSTDASDELRAVRVDLAHPRQVGEAELALSPALAELLAIWPEDVVDLRIAMGAASARRALDLDRAAAQAAELAALLSSALDALAGAATGPYR